MSLSPKPDQQLSIYNQRQLQHPLAISNAPGLRHTPRRRYLLLLSEHTTSVTLLPFLSSVHKPYNPSKSILRNQRI